MLEIKSVTATQNSASMQTDTTASDEFWMRLTAVTERFKFQDRNLRKRKASREDSFEENEFHPDADTRLLDVGIAYVPGLNLEKLDAARDQIRRQEARRVLRAL